MYTEIEELELDDDSEVSLSQSRNKLYVVSILSTTNARFVAKLLYYKKKIYITR